MCRHIDAQRNCKRSARAKIGQNAKRKICRPNGWKKPKNANKPNTKSTVQSAFKKAKFQLFGLKNAKWQPCGPCLLWPNGRPSKLLLPSAEILFSSDILCNKTYKRLGSRGWARCNLQNNNKRLASLRDLPYRKIKTRLKRRRLLAVRGDMIEVFKIVHNDLEAVVNLNFNTSNTTSGNK